MRWAFWVAIAIITYSYAGYPVWLWLRKSFFLRRVCRAPYIPPISIVMVVRNEAAVLERKLRNLLTLDYPADKMEIVVVSDGCTDNSLQLLLQNKDPRLKTIASEEPRGKATGLNEALLHVQGEVIVFVDARQQIENTALRSLLENFSDDEVGCVSGELMLGDPETQEITRGMGTYWKIEKQVRIMESATGSVIGATGALYAVRRRLIPQLPPETILDDVYIPLHVVRQGKRVIFDPRARAWDNDLGAEREFSRKVRTLTGNYQLLLLAPWLLKRENPARFRFVSHKLSRLLVPFALIALFISSIMLPDGISRIALALQIALYGLGISALLQPRPAALARTADIALSFILLNAAAMFAFANFVSRRKVVWVRPAA